MNKTAETLTEIMHLAAAALITRDAGIERIALGDIAEALSKAMPPADDGRAGAPPPAATSPHKAMPRVAKTPSTVVMQAKLPSGRVVSAELENESTSHRAQAYLYDGENNVCMITFFNQYQGRAWAYPIVRRALNGLMSKAGKNARRKANAKKVEKVGGGGENPLSTSTSSLDLDLDLAQRMENA